MTDDETFDIVTLEDENGAEVDFAFLGTVDIDEQAYAVLCPYEQLEAEDPDLDLYAFKYTETDDGAQLDAVEDSGLLERIFTLAETELFGDDEDDWDDDDWDDED